MKVSILLVCVLASLMVADSDAFIGRFGFGGFGFRRFGFGFRRFGFGPFGFGGFGRFGFGPFGFRRPVVLPVPVPVPAGIIGKRSVGEMPIENMPVENMPVENMPVENMPVENMPVENMPMDMSKTQCTFSSKTNMLMCEGEKWNLECEAMATFVDDKKMDLNLNNLMIVEDILPIAEEKEMNPVTYKLLSMNEKTNSMNEWTTMDKTMPMIFSIYESDKIFQNGIKITDKMCWNKFDTMMRSVEPTDVSMSMIMSN